MHELDWKNIAKRFSALYVPAVCDVLDRRGFRHQYLDFGIKPIDPQHKLAGPAFTIVGMPNSTTSIDDRRGPTVVDQIPEHSVAVYDTNNTTSTGVWGELWTNGAIRRGCVGALVDGAIRDSALIRKKAFPVFCRWRVPADAVGRFNVIECDVPVSAGGVRILPGDYIFGDEDGVVAIPGDLIIDVLAEAEAIKLTEDEIRERINQDESLAELYKKYGRL